MELNRIVQGDSYELIKAIPNGSVNLVITSPPYFQQRSYTDDEREIGNEEEIVHYIDRLLIMFRECLRVLKPDGNIIWNLGDKYIKSSLQLIPYRFAISASHYAKLVNNVSWVKTNPVPRQFRKRLVSSHEPFFHFAKSNEYYFQMPDEAGPKRSMTNYQSNRYFDLIDQSELTEEQKLHAKKDLCKVIAEVKDGTVHGFRLKLRGIHAMPFGGQEGGRKTQILTNGYTIIRIYGRKLQKDVFESAVDSIKWKKHPAVYPLNIVERFLGFLTKEDDIVLDPFMGSGTTGLACKNLKRNFVGFELCKEFVEEANNRLK